MSMASDAELVSLCYAIVESPEEVADSGWGESGSLTDLSRHCCDGGPFGVWVLELNVLLWFSIGIEAVESGFVQKVWKLNVSNTVLVAGASALEV
jgi:hypothetical protein